MLTETQQQKWDFYQRAKKANVRSVALRALDAFLDSLAESPQEQWFSWALSLAERIEDEGDPTQVPQSLIERAIVPALLAGYQAQLPGCARWLASYCNALGRVQCDLTPLGELQPTEECLLREALRQDPTDRQARLRELIIRARQFAFALHELPAGVLYGMDGATPEQCVELEQELDEFCREFAEVAEMRGTDQLQTLIADARFHFRTYREFLLSSEVSQGYAAYLERHANGRSEK